LVPGISPLQGIERLLLNAKLSVPPHIVLIPVKVIVYPKRYHYMLLVRPINT
jgi:hypothetical protein